MPDSSSRFELTLDDERFPDGVRELEDAPERLYAWGNLDVLNAPALAVIGARSATPYGIAVAEIAGRVAAQSSVAVVSGGARGCDAAAGTAALDAGGVHIAVLGCGADVVYPRSSATLLARTIEAGGLILSLDPWGSPPRKWAFPRRNRVIAALSSAVMITEAGLPSGTFSTAETAMDLGRELLAVPGSILSPQSRYGEEGTGDYLNAPFTKEEYEAFIEALTSADRVVLKDFERRELFQACQPAEEVARTGTDAIRFGAMKPVGLTDPRTGRRPWAAVQLRTENAEHTAYNLVGFQTNLTFGEQRRVFRMIPGLENAEFFRYGVMHRNTFVDAPHVLDATFAVPGTRVRLAGQITGTEGYLEAVASGLLAALNTVAELAGVPAVQLPRTGALGSLVAYATDPATESYQPMHVNFGIVPSLEDGKRRSKRDRYAAYAARAEADLAAYLATRSDLFDQNQPSIRL